MCFLRGCGAVPDPASPGSCKLKCNTSRIAGVESKIELMGDEPYSTISCEGIGPGSEYRGNIPVKFKFVTNQPNLPADDALNPSSGAAGDSGGAAGAAAGGGGAVGGGAQGLTLNNAPAGNAGVSFSVNVIQGTLSGGVNPGEGDDSYLGIATPIEEWCTDSCGVGTINIRPLCLNQDNNIKLLVSSGQVYKVINIIASGQGGEDEGEGI